MQTTKVKKDELLAIIKNNRDQHRAVFLEAQDGYRKKVIEVLEDRLAAARNGGGIDLSIKLASPVDQTKDYDRVIKMMEMGTEDIIELDEQDFSQYVMDAWGWAKSFITSNSAYVSSVSSQAYFRKLSE